MRSAGRHMVSLGLCAVLVAAPSSSWARGGHDEEQDRARRAFEQGEVLPLAEILARAGDELGGEVVGVSFARERDRWVYGFKVIGAGGRLVEVHVDAATAEILQRDEAD